MKRFSLSLCLALVAAACAVAVAGANSGTNKTQFTLEQISDYSGGNAGPFAQPAGTEEATATGQVVATRARKSDPVKYSLSVITLGLPATSGDNGTPEDPSDDPLIAYCLYGDTDGHFDGAPPFKLAEGTVDRTTGVLKLEYATTGALPAGVNVADCATGATIVISNSAITAPPSSAK